MVLKSRPRYLTKPKYKLEILTEEPTLIIPDVPPENGTYVIDTSQLFAALEGDGESRRKLEDVYRRLKHDVRYDFHNAGNDAKVPSKPNPCYSLTHNVC